MNYIDVVTSIAEVSLRHRAVESFHNGMIEEENMLWNRKFPVVWLDPIIVNMVLNERKGRILRKYIVPLICGDKTEFGINQKEVTSTLGKTFRIIQDILIELSVNKNFKFDTVTEIRHEPFVFRGDYCLTGWICTFQILDEQNAMDICEIPFDTVPKEEISTIIENC